MLEVVAARTEETLRKFLTHADPAVPMHHPRILVEVAVEQGAPRDELLAFTGITPAMLSSPEARISYLQFASLTNNAIALTGNPGLGIDFGKRIHLSHLGMLGLAVMSASTLGKAFDLALKYYRSLAPAWDLSLDVEGSRAIFRAREALALSPFRVFATEALLMAEEAMGRYLLGRDVPVLELHLNYSEPPHGNRYTESPFPVYFDQPLTMVVFDPAVLDEPLVGSDPVTLSLAERHCEAMLTSVAPTEGLLGQARRMIRASPGEYPDPETLAKTLRTSPRSLRRSLQSMGTSYQELLDGARRAHAMHCVETTDMTVEQISEQVGFSDVRSFRRAFKRWTGATLNDYRSAALGRAAAG